MSHPFILPGNPTFGTQLAQQLSQGVNKGLEKGLSAGLSGFLRQKKELGKIRSNINQLSKRYEKGAYAPETLNTLEKRAAELSRLGNLSAEDATLLAFEEFNQKSASENPTSENQKSGLSALFTPKEEASKIRSEQLEEGIKKLGSKIAYPFVGAADFPNNVNQELQQGIRDLSSFVSGETPEEKQTHDKAYDELLKKYPGIAASAGLNQPNARSFTEDFLELTGGRGPGENPLERILQGSVAGIPGMVTQAANEILDQFGDKIPAPLRAAVEAYVFIESMRRGKNIKSNTRKAFSKIFDKASKISQETKLPVEQVIQEAKNASGADFDKALAGDASEINKLNKKITSEAPGAEKVKATEKTVFNPKEAIKQREAFGQKVSSSPLAEYLAPEKTVEHRPETVAKQKQLAEEINPKISKLEKDISSDRTDLRQMQLSRKEFKGNDLARVESNIGAKERVIQKKMDELRDLRYELKYSRKPPTEAEIDSAIKKSSDAIVEEARNPTAEGTKKAKKQLELDKQYIEKAEKLAQRGELPGDIRPDTHIKMKQKYLDGYNAMIKSLRDEIKSLKGARDAESLKKIADHHNAINMLESRARRLKSDIVNQTDKVKAIRGLEGASGAFYKNQLKGLHKDVAQFQHDFFKYTNEKSVKNQITEKTAEGSIKEVGKQFEKAQKLGEEVGKNPTEKNIQEGAKETGQNPEEIKQETKKLGDEFSERSKRIKEGKATEQDVQKTEKSFRDYFRLKRNLKSGGVYFGVGVFFGIIENEFGIKIPQKYLFGITPFIGRLNRAAGRSVGYGGGYQLVNYIYNNIESSKLKELRKNPNEYSKYVQSLRKRYSAQRVNKIIKSSTE